MIIGEADPALSWDALEVDFVITLREFLDENPEFKQVSYIAVRTLFTDRILSEPSIIQYLTPCVVYPDLQVTPFSQPRVSKLVLSQKADNICRMFAKAVSVAILTGTCVFRAEHSLQLPEIIHKLHRVDYCRFCHLQSITSVTFYALPGSSQKLMFVELECLET